jgi:hypothetical protein
LPQNSNLEIKLIINPVSYLHVRIAFGVFLGIRHFDRHQSCPDRRRFPEKVAKPGRFCTRSPKRLEKIAKKNYYYSFRDEMGELDHSVEQFLAMIQMWRHTLMHTSQPRYLLDETTGRSYRWLLHWNERRTRSVRRTSGFVLTDNTSTDWDST